MASDSELVEKLHEILRCSDLDTATAASVRRQLEDVFGVDLSSKKAYIRQQIDLFLETLHANEGDQAEDTKREGSTSETCGAATEEDGEEDGEEEEGEERVEKEAKKGRGGFSKVCSLSPNLQVVVGEAELARTEVVKRLWKYIRERGLQDPKNKRNIVCDDALHALFRVKTINMFQMNKALSKHIWPLNSEDAADAEEAGCSSQEDQTLNGKEDEPETKERKPRGKKRGSDGPQNGGKKRGGFNKLSRLSPKLREFTGAPEMARTDVVKQLWAYIRENNLQDPSDKRRILCDERLQSLFDVVSINMFQMNKALSRHIFPLHENVEEQGDGKHEEEETEGTENNEEAKAEEESNSNDSKGK